MQVHRRVHPGIGALSGATVLFLASHLSFADLTSCLGPHATWAQHLPSVLAAVAGRGEPWLVEPVPSDLLGDWSFEALAGREPILASRWLVYFVPRSTPEGVRRGEAVVVEEWSRPDGSDAVWRAAERTFAWAQVLSPPRERFDDCGARGFGTRFSVRGHPTDADLAAIVELLRASASQPVPSNQPGETPTVSVPIAVDAIAFETDGGVSVRTRTSVGSGQEIELKSAPAGWQVVRVSNWMS
jgi:hypothetical protein